MKAVLEMGEPFAVIYKVVNELFRAKIRAIDTLQACTHLSRAGWLGCCSAAVFTGCVPVGTVVTLRVNKWKC